MFWSYLIVDNHCRGVIADYNTTGCVSIYAILLNLWEAAARYNDASTLIFVNVILRYVCWAIEEHDSIIAIVNSVALDPWEPGLNRKYTLWSTRVDVVVVDYCVWWTLSTKGNVRFEVWIDFVLFYMGGCSLYQKNALAKVTKNVILDNSNCSTFGSLDASKAVGRDRRVLLNLCEVVCSSTHNTIILIFLNIV